MHDINSNALWAKVDSFHGNTTKPQLTYYRPCPICGSLKSKVVLQLDNFQFYSDSAEHPKRVDVHEHICLDCFALYLNPCYSDYGLRTLFAEAGQSYGSTDSHSQEQVEWLAGRGLLEGGNCVLDVGCYEGTFLARLPSHVSKVGVDIDRPAIERARARYSEQGIRFIHGTLETFELPEEVPDTITMFHVLEHLARPVEVLLKLRSISNRDTRLIVEVPILENAKTNDINGFFSIQHMTHFSVASLNNCLAQGGWSIEARQEQQDYNGYRVVASPTKEPSRDHSIKEDAHDWRKVLEYFNAWYGALAQVEARIKAIPNAPRLVVWGGGAHTEFLYHVTTVFHGLKDREYTIVDSDALKRGRTWRGIPISSPLRLEHINWDETALLISSYSSQNSILAAARDLHMPEHRITCLYDEVRRY